MVDLKTAHSTGMGSFTPHEALCWNRSGSTLVVGNCVMLDHSAGQETVEGDVEDGRPGMDLAIESNVVAPATAYIKHGIFGFVKSLGSGGGADNTQVLVKFSGLMDILVDDAAALDAGEAVHARNGDLVAIADIDGSTAAVGEKLIGYLREGTAGGGGDVLASAMIDGVNGIGSANDQ